MMRYLIALALLGCATTFAQETSVAPGINDNFKDPNVDEYVARFEGESREIYTHRQAILDALDLKPGMCVGDIGAGTGFFSMMISDVVGTEGRVYAVDIAKNFVEHINKISAESGRKNVEGVVCDERSARLPVNSIDLAFICDTYHHFEYPFDTLKSIHDALRPGGKLVIVDFVRIEGRSSDWTLKHVRRGMGGVIDELQQAGFDFLEKKETGMKEQYMITFVKRAAEVQPAKE